MQWFPTIYLDCCLYLIFISWKGEQDVDKEIRKIVKKRAERAADIVEKACHCARTDLINGTSTLEAPGKRM